MRASLAAVVVVWLRLWALGAKPQIVQTIARLPLQPLCRYGRPPRLVLAAPLTLKLLVRQRRWPLR